MVGSSAGKRSKAITVKTNDPANKFVKLSVAAVVKVILSASPNRLYLGSFMKGKSPTKYIALDGEDSVSTNITKAEISGKNDFLKVDIVNEEQGDNQNKKIIVKVLPGVKIGKIREKITIHTDHKKINKLIVYVYGEVKGDISVKPTSVSLGVFNKNKRIVKKIKLDAVGNTSFKVLNVVSTDPEIKAELETVKEGTSYYIKVSPVEGYTQNLFKGDILIKTDNKDQGEIKVKFFGRVKKDHSKNRKLGSDKK